MKTAIVYASKHGCTDKCAHTLANELNNNAALINLDRSTDVNLDEFDTIILGGSIHAGAMNRKIKKFTDKYLELLTTKKTALFICCMEEGEKAQEQFQNAFPESLREQAIAHGYFGGEFNFDKMNFFEKAIIKKIAKTDRNVSRIKDNNIKEFARQISV
ncbi:MAG: flavodoxin domain-containing protein [Bacteroidales bacterium]|jgi:menaquinone-dependent protoporphyrinogen oxidase|nr:flavodoxin domain-containing protein [Bacteroidales bacterium]